MSIQQKLLFSPELWAHEIKYRQQIVKKYRFCKIMHMAFPERDNFKRKYVHSFISKMKYLRELLVTDIGFLNYITDYFAALKSQHKTIRNVNLPLARRYNREGFTKKSLGRSLIHLKKIDFSHEVVGTLKYIAKVDQINVLLNQENMEEVRDFFRFFQKAKRWAIKGSLDNSNLFLSKMERSLEINKFVKLVLNVSVSNNRGEFMNTIRRLGERVIKFELDILQKNISQQLLENLDANEQSNVEILNLHPLTSQNEIVELYPDIFTKITSYSKLNYLSLPVHFTNLMNNRNILEKIALPSTLKTLNISFRTLDLSDTVVFQKLSSCFADIQNLSRLELYLEKLSKGKKDSPNVLLNEMLVPLKKLNYLKVSLDEYIPKMYDPIYEFDVTKLLISLRENTDLENLTININLFNQLKISKAPEPIVFTKLRKFDLNYDRECTGESLNLFEFLNPKMIDEFRINIKETISPNNLEEIFYNLAKFNRLYQLYFICKVSSDTDKPMGAFNLFLKEVKTIEKFSVVIDGLKISNHPYLADLNQILKSKPLSVKGDIKLHSHKITTQASFPKIFLVKI